MESTSELAASPRKSNSLELSGDGTAEGGFELVGSEAGWKSPGEQHDSGGAGADLGLAGDQRCDEM
jgi:hypothetical protein